MGIKSAEFFAYRLFDRPVSDAVDDHWNGCRSLISPDLDCVRVEAGFERVPKLVEHVLKILLPLTGDYS